MQQSKVALDDAAEWLGDWHPLAEQLGSADGLVTLSSVSALLRLRPVQDCSSLRSFLVSYREQILVPLELPAIQLAFGYAERNGLRELIELDQELAQEPLLRNFAGSSRRVGQGQLQKLRPLRDHRLVQRYLAAVDGGAANGWHMLVYGLTLEIYSLPLRQGLLGYAQQTTRGFIYTAARMLRLSERRCRDLFDELNPQLANAVHLLVRQEVVA